jgi:hypothetical protein
MRVEFDEIRPIPTERAGGPNLGDIFNPGRGCPRSLAFGGRGCKQETSPRKTTSHRAQRIIFQNLQFNSPKRAHWIYGIPIRRVPPAPNGSICQDCPQLKLLHSPATPRHWLHPNEKNQVTPKKGISTYRNRGLTPYGTLQTATVPLCHLQSSPGTAG